MDINIAVVSGYVKGEPKYYNGESAVAKFTVACGRGKTKDGTNKGYDYIDVSSFGGGADYVKNSVHDGSYVTVYGRNTSGSYTNRDGQTVYTKEIVSSIVKSEPQEQAWR